MKYGNKLTFWYLLNNFKIQIPEIQRDYVQGRDSDIIKRNKEDLIKKMVSSVVNNTCVDLNFTYGMNHNKLFIPIDGQQRLTTLFLFHFYLSVQTNNISNDKQFYENFTYKTRRTSDKFLKLLLQNSESLFISANKEKVANNIENSNWFINSFKHDLTIVSMLNVLKQIEYEFSISHYFDWTVYYNSLFKLNNSGCPITFMFIELDVLNDDNELYVKMNSRGKQLTDFENFKSDLYDFIDNPIKAENQQEIDEKNELKSILTPTLIKEFKKSIDGTWLDVFWSNLYISQKYTGVEDRASYIDSLFKNLFHYIFVNQLVSNDLCNHENDFGHKWISPESEWNHSLKIGFTFMDQYIEFNSRSITISYRKCLLNAVKDFKYVMDYFSTNTDSIIEFLHLDDKSKIKKFNLNEYKERAYLNVLCLLGNTSLCSTDRNFAYYKRSLKHIIDNTEIDNESKFINFIKGIKSSISYAIDFENKTLSIDADYQFNNAFDKSICEEELLKNRLRYKNSAIWETAIDDAEQKGDYPGSQIGFLFDFLSITCSDYNDENKRDRFILFTNALSDIFNYKVEHDKHNLLHRTLLTYVMTDSNRLLELFAIRGRDIYSFCSNKNDDFRHRNNDWRGQLLINTYFKNKFKTMYEEYVNYKNTNPTVNTFESFSNEKITNFIEDYSTINKHLISVVVKYDWILPFKNHEHKYYFVKDGNSFSFLKTTQRHEMYDIHLYHLDRMLVSSHITFKHKLNDNKYLIKVNGRIIDFDINTNCFVVIGTPIMASNTTDFINQLRINNII